MPYRYRNKVKSSLLCIHWKAALCSVNSLRVTGGNIFVSAFKPQKSTKFKRIHQVTGEFSTSGKRKTKKKNVTTIVGSPRYVSHSPLPSYLIFLYCCAGFSCFLMTASFKVLSLDLLKCWLRKCLSQRCHSRWVWHSPA